MNILQPNWTYRFAFISDFSKFDGTYTVCRIYSYPEFLKEHVDLYSTLYQPCNLTEARFEEDSVRFIKESIIKLQSPFDEDNVIYIPELILLSYPIYNVQEYSDVTIAFHLGVYPNGEEFKSVLNNISQEISSSLGILQEPKVIIVGKEYLTDDEYNQIKEERNKLKSSTLNYFSENVKLNNEVLTLRNRIQKLESYIKKLSE